MGFAAILAQVALHRPSHVTVTGGEPLAQKPCLALLTQLCDRDYVVSLETSGALDISSVDPRVIKIIDIKTPGSHAVNNNLQQNLPHINHTDQLKFVICHRADYRWAKELLQEHKLHKRCELLFSPSYQQQSATELANWILADKLPVRLQLQLHKILWGEVPGR